MKQELLVVALICLIVGYLLGNHFTGNGRYEMNDGYILDTATGKIVTMQAQWQKDNPGQSPSLSFEKFLFYLSKSKV